MQRWSSILVGVVILTLGFGVGRLSAGLPDAPGSPTTASAQMHSLEQIYRRIADGGTFIPKPASFGEPVTPPGTGTMHTLDEIYDLLATSAHVPRTSSHLCPCDTPGDDGFLRRGVLWPFPRFTDNGNGTVKDNLTGLLWLKNSNCFGARMWANALADANGLASGACGLADGSTAGQWRLPNIRELLSLIDYTTFTPAIPTGTPFTGVQASVRYWSSTVVANNTPNAWNIDFDIGTVNRNQAKTTPYYVWPVRGGQNGQ
jgi:hypothetical protein